MDLENMSASMMAERDHQRALQKALGAGAAAYGLDRESVSEVLEEVNTRCEGYGIEPVRDPQHWDGYFGDVKALYVNMGDPYVTTVIYDAKDGLYRVMTLGDWIEEKEAEGEEFV